jgi:predicted PurR-regulated permease PerM
VTGGAEPLVSETRFARRVLIAVLIGLAVFALALLLARHPEVPLLLFGGILGAVFLDALARPLRRWLHAPRPVAIGAVALLLVLAAGVAIWLIGPRVADQASKLGTRLPELLDTLQSRIPIDLRSLADQKQGGSAWSRIAPYVFGSLSGIFSSTFAVLSGALAGFALSIFLALKPETYRDGLARLLPANRRPRLCEVTDAAANALRWWIVGRAIAMAIVGVLTAVGLVVLGVPLALSLALLAGVLTFVPYIGPLLAAVPAVLLALSESTQLALGVAALYWGIQLVENYVVTPVVQGRAVSVPPALLLVAQLSVGVLLGGLGLLLSTPLAVVLMVFVQMLYVQDVLGEPVKVLGEPDTSGRQQRPSPLRARTNPTRS